MPPFLLKTNDNPEGVNKSVFDGIMAAVVADRYAYLKDFLDNFYNVDKLRPARISDQAWQASWNVGAGASAHATLACVPTWLTDFRGDLPKIDVPTLVVQGTEDRTLPVGSTGRRLPALINDVRFVEVEEGPHNIGWTHADGVNKALVRFSRRLAAHSGGQAEDHELQRVVAVEGPEVVVERRGAGQARRRRPGPVQDPALVGAGGRGPMPCRRA